MRWLAVPIMLGILMGGCVTPDDATTDAGTSPDGAAPHADALPWGLDECRYIVALGWVDGDRLAPYLPEGFTARPSPLVPVGDADTWFGFDVMECASGVGLNGAIAPIQFGYLWAGADPPEAYLQADVDASEHYAMWDILVPDADRRAVLASRGVPVLDGEASLTVGPAAIDAALTLDGLGRMTITAVPPVERSGAFEGSFVKMSSAEGGAAAWRSSATSGPRMNGYAMLTFPAGSWPADVVGGTELVGQFHSGTWSYTDAEIRFVGSTG